VSHTVCVWCGVVVVCVCGGGGGGGGEKSRQKSGIQEVRN